MNPRDALREEHGAIMKMLATLHRFIAEVADLKEADTKDLKALIEFFEIYVDRCHHGKEEQVLFPALSRVRTAGIDSLINSLMEDHREARTIMEQIESNAVTLHSCSEADRYEFRERVDRYVDLVRKHIRKENSELLPLIEERLSETERLQMAGQFRDLEKTTLGSSGLEVFPASVRRLSQKYTSL
ncbi:MAG: hemerythrin domain-containing protein [Syntrophobacteraceae bacterium]